MHQIMYLWIGILFCSLIGCTGLETCQHITSGTRPEKTRYKPLSSLYVYIYTTGSTFILFAQCIHMYL